MLSAATLMSAQSIITNMFSPSVNPCMKRVAATRFRHEPYNARVLPAAALMRAIVESPAARKVVASVARTPVKVATTTTTISSSIAMTMSPKVKSIISNTLPRFATVHFKHTSCVFLAPFRITVGDLVVVDGDRGEDIGTVSSISTEVPVGAITNKVVRRATDKDRETLDVQRNKELAAIEAIQTLATSLRLNATIEDAEYQFDMNKLTVFVRRSAKGVFVDFRKLQRGLFREFRCRIWCVYMDEIEQSM